MFCLDILALFTAAGAAWQDMHFRKVSNRYLVICLGLAVLFNIWIGVQAFACGQSFDYAMLADRKVNLVIKALSDAAVNIRPNMALDSSSDTMGNMMMVMAFNIGAGMAVPVLLLGWAFRLRKIGAGDIKLLAVLGAMMGPDWILNCMLWTCLIALAMEGMKWTIRHFEYSLWRNKKNSEEKVQIQCLANVRKRGIPLALSVFLATVSGICGMY